MRIILFFILFACAHLHASELQTVQEVDLKRFMGTWYQIARFQNPWQPACGVNTTFHYALQADGSVKMSGQCQYGAKLTDVQKVEGKATVVDSHTNAKLKVTYQSPFLHNWVFDGDYWIIQLADDYSYAVVAEPTGAHLWILSRTPSLSEDTYQNILNKVTLQLPNLNILSVLPTEQNREK